ncbi:MAG TPA: DNA polymerase [Kofleriaceae bacterium]|nr:DNA polymerase [Kofleriaceae bacterium]
MADRTLIVSATNVLARGFLVVPTDRRSPAGEPVNALFALARGILSAIAFKVPARAVAVIEAGPAPASWPPILREQLPRVEELARTLGCQVVTARDEVHVVASYARAALAAGDDVVVVGVDKRYAQLVGDRLWWYDANKDARYTPEMVHKRFGVPPGQVAEWLGLVGDDDALPGVAGIGAKGATQLLGELGNVEAALAAEGAIRGRTGNALRAAGPEAIRTELARARLDATRPLPAELDACVFAPTAYNALFERLGFVELLAASSDQIAVAPCESVAQLAALGAGPVAVDPALEDDGGLAGLGFSAGGGTALYAAFAGLGPTIDVATLRPWLEDPSVAKLAHEREALVIALARHGIALAGSIGDSAAASHLTQPSNWAPHDLVTAAKHALGRALPDQDATRGVGGARKPWGKLSIDRAAAFVGRNADATVAIWTKLAPAIEPALLAEYLALSETLVRMELHGIAIDVAELERAERDFGAIEAELEREITAHAGHEFNINSSKQLGAVLFEQLKLPVVSHTKTGWGTSIEALERIEHAHPIVPLVLRWRQLRRLRDSWLISLRNFIHADGRVHSRVYPARSFSGHLVNTSPDLGRVPGRTPEMARIRRAFVAAPGHMLFSVDYNQLGLHVLAHLTRDPALVGPLRERADMHRLTASAVLDKPPAAIVEDERQLGKVVNFATFAGQGSSALAQQLNISAQQAKEYIARFDRHYALVRAFQDEQLRLARERGYIETIAGRHWPIGGLESLDSHDRSYAERLARRATHEGSVSDVARRGLLDADRALRAAGLHAQPLAQILDEVLFEVPEHELAAAARIAAHAMRHAFELEVPLVVGVEAGPNWADLVAIEA